MTLFFNLGLPKSGTTTLATAWNEAGRRVADWRLPKAMDPERPFIGGLLYKGYYDSGDPLQHLSGFDAFAEVSALAKTGNFWPQMDWGLIDALRKHHSVKFTFTHRDPVKHADSMLRWNNLGSSRIPHSNIPGAPKGFAKGSDGLARWIEGHATFVRHVFANDPDFLEIDVAEATAKERLEQFSGIALPWWGTANANTKNTVESDG
ncbi:hypothetical protein AQS8620_00905 [Aquimixticola soesokkakensis]|uniref:Sulfotransferase family protein n=1 Tax=Aquimixticola soesokkakensis TaxID=1519096 RepID=A0A1Y5S3S3_9RHOB|nr:hypothetical protein [Aquimixticola soesokkakensis]SLN29376.1 hypothetical protein AQS8620_00905 [Aquimixticola soesokkakensis]